MSGAEQDRVRRAIEILAAEARERVRRHPLGHLAGAAATVTLRVALPLALPEARLGPLVERASGDLDEAVQGLLHHLRAFRPGRVFCLRCRSGACEHSAPRAANEVFAGYGPSGQPRFAELAQWLLERRDPRVDRLYREPPQLVVRATPGEELAAALLPAFHDAEGGFRLHGQVEAGCWRARDAAGVPQPIAVSLQLLSSGPRRRARRFALNVVGVAPGGEPIEVLYDRMGEIPWSAAAAWAQEALASVERWAARDPAAPREDLDRRLDGILRGLAHRLEKERRGRDRRTRHAQDRHRGRERPTWKALADLAAARAEGVFADLRRGTLVVLGEHGRAHIFNPQGRLVTSVRYPPAAIERKVGGGVWRPARAEEVEGLRQRAVALVEAPADL